MSVSVIVLAAGAGKRMRSELPKPLHPVCGRPMVLRVIDAVADVDPSHVIVVIGHGASQVAAALDTQAPDWARLGVAVQEEQNGTGHAAAIGLAALATGAPDDTVVILPGDTPLLRRETIAQLCAARVERGEAATVLSSTLDDPTGYGRIVRDEDGRVIRIVEQRDASEAELAIREWNTGVYAIARGLLAPALDKLGTDNAQGEYYLTDVIAALAADGHQIGTVLTDPEEAHGVNDRDQLAEAETIMKRRLG
ncbi:MAG: NTP transferase domain-containing protein [Actinomycetota bacterium]|jgi:bifunctional UDP-N-acetylglucosamine pyrophosphorylase/glucosamine-1-phosphate N-acetyltransferase|nr:NTP transferase domain-containing protein [Actinomycetota bacterium]MDA3015137.1 NTP transferase domain-containing protein [Actinomycetota bacterium]MDA3027425.1 NTP transferase domain-containing protein [Actinomycetota bacterium]